MNILFRIIVPIATISAALIALTKWRMNQPKKIGEHQCIIGRLAVAPYHGPDIARLPIIMPAQTHEERLAHLEQLRAQGLISEQEYGERRRQILGEL